MGSIWFHFNMNHLTRYDHLIDSVDANLVEMDQIRLFSPSACCNCIKHYNPWKFSTLFPPGDEFDSAPSITRII